MRTVLRKLLSAATALAMAASAAVLPAAAAEDAGEAYYFSDDFERYTEGQAIPAAAAGGIWEQTQSGGFYAVKDPTDDGNTVGIWGTAGGTGTGAYVTNRTPAINMQKPTLITGRIYLDGAPMLFNIPGISQALYFYGDIAGNGNARRILLNDWSALGSWVPDEWINYTLCVNVDVDDPANSMLSVFLDSEAGLLNTEGEPVKSLYKTMIIDMSNQSLENMIKMDSNQSGSSDCVYMDDVTVRQVSNFELAVPENKNVKGSAVVEFSMPIAKSLITADNFKLETSDGEIVEITSVEPAGEEKWAVDENTGWVTSAVITPSDGFESDTVYKLSAMPGLKDYVGNTCGNIVYLSTNDSEPPASEAADILVNGILLDPSILSLPEDLSERGLDCVVAATVYPENAANKEIVWSSENESVARVEQNGNVIPVAPGETVITVSAADGSGVSADIDVTVTAERAEDQKLNISAEEVPERDIAAALEYPTDEETAKVALWKDNAKGAVSITTDDGTIYWQCFPDWIEYKEKYGYNITFFPWTADAATDSYKSMFRPLVEAGMDIQSHSKTHHSDHQQKFLTTGQLIEEYYQPVRTTGAQVLAYPYGLQPYSDNVDYENESVKGVPFDEEAYASLYYIAARNGGVEINMPTRTAGANQTAMNYMALSAFSIHPWHATTYGTSDTSIEGLIKSPYDEDYLFNGTANIGGWGILLVHGLDESPSSGNPSYPGQQATNKMIFDDTFEYLKEAGDMVWTDSMLDISKYGQERDTAELNVVSSSDEEIVYTLTDKMDDEIFDYPLTVMVKIPEDWRGAAAVQDGEKLESYIKDGYLFVETVPDRGSVSVTKAAADMPGNTVSADVVKAWPEGRLKAFTASFDDGYLNYENEKWLVDTFRANGIKATFNMPSGLFRDSGADAAAYKELYEGFEVAAHTEYHSRYSEYTPDFFDDAVKADLEALPAITDGAIEGIAYPNGESANEEQKEILEENGILYGRSTYSSRNFEIPDDLYNWNPTCFQYNTGEFQSDTQRFAALSPSEMKLMEVWGHGYQLNDGNKEATRQAFETIGGRDDIYYASNAEIAKYLNAIDRLVISESTSGEGETEPGSSVLVDPCTVDPLEPDAVFAERENGIGQAVITDASTGESDTAYSRYDMADGRVHSLIYTSGASDFTGVNLRTYSRSTSDTARFSPFKVYASSDGSEYTEIKMDYNQIGDRNDWYLYRVDYTNNGALPEGTKYIKVSFPEDYIVNPSDSANEALLGNVELAMENNGASSGSEIVTTVYNPSDMNVWVNAGGQGVEIPAGEVKYITASASGTSGALVDPCTADPLEPDAVFAERENGIGQAVITDASTGESDTAYSRYDMADGRVHSLIYSSGTSDFTGVELRTYSRSTSDTERFSPFKVYASPDGSEYTEIAMSYNQIGDRNDWYLYRVDYTNSAALPEGTKYIKVSFPEDYIVNPSDSANEALLGNVELAMDSQKSIYVFDELPGTKLSASSFDGDSLSLVFSKEMDAASVAEAVSFDGAFSVSPQTNSKAFTVSFDEPLEQAAEYTVTIDGAKSAGGETAETAEVSFKTEDLINRVLEDKTNDYRYVYEFGGNISILSGVGGENEIGFARTAADTPESTSYVIYRAPYGNFTSLSLQLYRNEGACANPFTVYAASEDKVFEKVADDSEGERSAMIDKGYYPIQLDIDSLPEDTEYIKIEFPSYSESDGETAYHMAQIANVKAAYSADGAQAAAEAKILAADDSGKVIAAADSVSAAEGANANVSVRISALDPALEGTSADILFAVYDGGVLKSCEIRNIELPSGGEPAFERISVPVGADEDITVKCMLWDSAESMEPLCGAVEK